MTDRELLDAAVQRIVELEAEIAALKAKHVATPSSHPEIPDNSQPVARVAGYSGGRCVIEPLDGKSVFSTGMAVYTRGMRELSDEEIIAVADAMDQFSLMLQDEIVRFARAILDAALAAEPQPVVWQERQVMSERDDYMTRIRAQSYMEQHYKWRENIAVIPFIKFPSDWGVQIIGPFSGAQSRFRVRLPNGEEKSVYLDMDGSLGYFCDDEGNTAPYWEVYPVDGDVGRCAMNETDELIRLIGEPR